MKLSNYILSVSTLALMATGAFAASNEPVYNQATVVDVTGIVTSARQVPAGSPMAGLHLMVKSKTGTVDAYMGPTNFLNFLKTSFAVGEEIEVSGSKVKFGNADVILTRAVDDGYELLTLRDTDGDAAWQNWGKEIDPALVQ
jgi:hypothetical protein